MRNGIFKISILLNYLLFGVLLNSVGIVIFQVQRFYKVTESAASVLEAFKDLTIAIVSFFIASFITRLGYKRSMLIGLAAVAIYCFLLPSLQTFVAVKLMFAITGASFALMKISVYGSIGLITKTDKEHISLMSFVESAFMIGVLSGYFLFSVFIDNNSASSAAWFNVYYCLGAVGVIAFLLLLFSPLDESRSHTKPEPNNITSKNDEGFIGMFKLLLLPMVISFIICAFLYVLLEQSIMSWLPTFNNKVLGLPASLSIILSSILSGSIALGRFMAGLVMKKLSWLHVLVFCLLAAALLVVIALPIAKSAPGYKIEKFTDIPFAAYIFPLIGFFLAPLYPAINSLVLASLPKNKHASMAGLIVVFSALGGSLGSIITGFIFQEFGGKAAFYFSILPITLLIISLILFKKRLKTITT